METNSFIFLLVAVSSLVGSPMVAVMPVHEPEGHIIKTAGIDFFESSKQPILLAENEQKTASEESKPQTDDRDQPIDTGEKSIEKNGKAEIEAPKKPLKPFKPSEKIAAEQAVDFPWDI